MLYLLDANCFIHAHNMYYPLDRVPEYWDWLVAKAQDKILKVPKEIFDEVAGGQDELADWMKVHQGELVLNETPDMARVQSVLNDGYAANLTQEELDKLGRDPFLISYGLGLDDRTIVSKEVSKPTKTRANRRVPDVCRDLGVLVMDDFQLIRTLNFSTKWKA